MNEPKLVSNDLFLFESLIKDLFPEEKNQKDHDIEFLQKVDQKMDILNLDKQPYFVEKVIQFHSTKNSRHGNIVIGKSMSGKTTLINLLKEI